MAGIVLSVIALIGLIVFVAFALYWFFAPARRTNAWPVALVGLVIWAIAEIILLLIGLF